MYSGSSFVDLSRCYLVSEFKILKKNADGELVNLAAGDNVSTIQLLGATFIRNLKVSHEINSYYTLPRSRSMEKLPITRTHSTRSNATLTQVTSTPDSLWHFSFRAQLPKIGERVISIRVRLRPRFG